MARIGHFCHECGEELPEGAATCPTHPDAQVDSVDVDDAPPTGAQASAPERNVYTDFGVSCYENHREVSFATYPTEAQARQAARAWAGPKQDKAYAQFAELVAYYTEKAPKGWGRTALVDSPKLTTLHQQGKA
jgi:hypothetical protein